MVVLNIASDHELYANFVLYVTNSLFVETMYLSKQFEKLAEILLACKPYSKALK